MGRRKAIVALCAVCAIALGAGVVYLVQKSKCGGPDPVTQAGVFSLIDGFVRERCGPAGTEPLPFVRIATGEPIRRGTRPPENQYRFGFLEADEAGTFTVRYVSLRRETFVASPAGTAEHERVGHESWDMAAYARAVAKGLTEPDVLADRYYTPPATPMAPKAEALLLACDCARRGLHEEADLLFAAAGPTKRAVNELANGFRNLLTMDFADPTLTRADLLARHHTWLEAFPKAWCRRAVLHQSMVLAKMIWEGRQARATDGQEGGEAARAIFALRDEFRPPQESAGINGWILPTAAPKAEDGSRPSDRLRAMGRQAVPALIAAVIDETPTRTVWYSSRYGGFFHVVQVGQFAEGLLEEHSGLTFYGDVGERQARWRRWWKVTSHEGEDAALAEIAARGDCASMPAARKLADRWPGRVADVMRGARRATNRHYRQDLVKIVSEVKAEPVTEFLLEELQNGPYVGARVEAARGLLDRGRREGLESLLRQWTNLAPRRRQADEESGEVHEYAEPGTGELAEFLLSSGDYPAVRTVGRRLATQPTCIRLAVFGALDAGTLAKALERAEPQERGRIEREFERMLGLFLDETYRHNGFSSFAYGDDYVTLYDPMTADLAACRLHQLWPHRYRFDPEGPDRLRSRRRAVVKNVWRERFGLAPVAVPRVPDVRSHDPEIPSLLDQIVKTGGPEYEAAAARVEVFGLGALPWVRDALQELPENHPARPALATLAARLCNVVREVTLQADVWRASGELKRQAASLEGRALDSGEFVELLLAAIRACPARGARIALSADRLADGTGVTVMLKIAPRPAQTSFASKVSVMAYNDRLYGWSSSGGSRAQKAEEYREFRRALERALDTSWDATFEARVELCLP